VFIFLLGRVASLALRLRLARDAANQVQGAQHKRPRRRSRVEPEANHIGEQMMRKPHLSPAPLPQGRRGVPERTAQSDRLNEHAECRTVNQYDLPSAFWPIHRLKLS